MSHPRWVEKGSGNDQGSGTLLSATQPFPASRKVYVEGGRPGVRVPMREISLTPTRVANGGAPSPNPPVTVYDTSGPYTDPAVAIDIRAGLAPLRREWILARADVETLADVTSDFGRRRAADPKLASMRFPALRKPLRAKPGRTVTQMHYARKGIITPEMEYIAIRENQARELSSPRKASDGQSSEQRGLDARRWLAAFLLAVAGVSFSALLTALQIFIIGAVCAYCLLSTGTAVGLFALLLIRRPAKAEWRPARLFALGGMTAVATIALGAGGFAGQPPRFAHA